MVPTVLEMLQTVLGMVATVVEMVLTVLGAHYLMIGLVLLVELDLELLKLTLKVLHMEHLLVMEMALRREGHEHFGGMKMLQDAGIAYPSF